MNLKGKKYENHGITLISLIVTIIILIILAGITIATITGNNGIIKNAKDAKEETEVSEEKEIVDRATIQSMGNNKKGNLIKEELQNQLDKITNGEKTEVVDAGEKFEILFKESNRYYTVDKDGNIIDQGKRIVDNLPGDITKDENGKELKGDESEPYEILCIEDLVAVSIATNGGNTELEIEMKNGDKLNGIQRSQYVGKYITLNRTLDFNSEFSYTNAERTDFGDINQDGKIEGIKQELTSKEGRGFIPIKNYRGVFDGKENEIRNIYEDTTNLEDLVQTGLFGETESATIKNVGVTGKIMGKWFAGGVASSAYSGAVIENCYNKADISGSTMVGGIVGNSGRQFKITKCKNYGNITITGSSWAAAGAGGITGSGKGNLNNIGNIEECENYGDVQGNYFCGGILGTSEYVNINGCENYGNVSVNVDNRTAGGIVAWHNYGTVNIINCSNNKKIHSNSSAGGIVGNSAGASVENDLLLKIENCYNAGELESSNLCGGIIGNQGVICKTNYITIENCYNIGKSSSTKYGGIMGIIYTSSKTETKTNVSNVYYLSTIADSEIVTGTYTGKMEGKDDAYMKSKNFVDLLNQNIGEKSYWKKWKQGENGYPSFE